MAYTAQPIIRKFDYGKRKIATELFAGPSSEVNSTNYPGDRKIVGDDSITIQLYHLGFENRPLDFPEHAYTLAINYPESLAANYCSNEQHNQLDDDDDDNED